MKKVEVRKKYSHEINDIQNKLNDLENGRIYELTDYGQDGYLATNIVKLRELLDDLIDKIEYDKESVTDQLSNIFEK